MIREVLAAACFLLAVALCDVRADDLPRTVDRYPVSTQIASAKGASVVQPLHGADGQLPESSLSGGKYRKVSYGIVATQASLLLILLLARLAHGREGIRERRSARRPRRLRVESQTRRSALRLLQAGKHFVFPVFLLGSIFAYGCNPHILVAVAALAMSVCLEYIIPYKPEWNRLGRQELNDVLHLFFSSVPGDTLARMVAFSLVPTLAKDLQILPDDGIWPRGLYFPLQVVLAVLLFEACVYTTHRLSHHVAWLWNFHRLHHTSKRITVSKGFRRNIQEALLESGVSLAVAVFCGVPANVLQWLVGFQLAGTIFAHANIDMYVPWLFERIFITPSVHRIHHSVDLRYGNTNFGNTLMVFDVLFGTFTDPRKHVLGETGIQNNSVPHGFLRQWFLPFYWRRLDQDPVKLDGWK